MSDPGIARRATLTITMAGVDISASMSSYLSSLTYTDNEEGEADDLQIQLFDRDEVWQTSWLSEIIESDALQKFKIRATINRLNWKSDGKDLSLPCGEFELDEVQCKAPPNTVTLKASSLPFTAAIRQTLRSKAWEKYNLSGIGAEMAAANGMSFQFLSSSNPYYERQEQTMESDISFLYKLCKNAGISLKVTAASLVLFDQRQYESKEPVMVIKRGCGYTSRTLSASTADRQYASCRVSYVDLDGNLIEGIAKVADYKDGDTNNQQLEITEKVASVAEAKALAEKRLRYANKYARTAQFTFPGNPALVAGVVVQIEGWGGWAGKYLVYQAKHTVSNGGYQTSISCRKVLEGY